MKKLSFSTLKNKNVKYGGYAALLTIAVFIGLIIINLIAGQFPGNFDLTKNKLFSLTDQTKNILSGLEREVSIFALYKTGEGPEDISAILKSYQSASSKIVLNIIDPDKNPTFVKKYDTDGKGIASGSVIVEQGKNFRVIKPYDMYDISYSQNGQPEVMGLSAEQRITGAILYVTSGYTPVLYELTGHGEDSFDTYGVGKILKEDNYIIKKLNLITSDGIPEDASVIAVLSPNYDLSQGEAEKIRIFLEGGGSGVFLMDFNSFDPMPGFASILQAFGIEFESGIIMESDPNHLYSKDAPFVFSPIIASHDITSAILQTDMTILMPYSQALKVLDIKKRNVEVTPLLTTSNKSWLRTTDSSTKEKLSTDSPGPLIAAAAVSNKQAQSGEKSGYRILVAGTTNFLKSIQPFGQLKGNIEFLLHGLSWLNNQTQTNSVTTKSTFKMPLRMSSVQVLIYVGIVIALIPLLIIIAGIMVYLKRRHL